MYPLLFFIENFKMLRIQENKSSLKERPGYGSGLSGLESTII